MDFRSDRLHRQRSLPPSDRRPEPRLSDRLSLRSLRRPLHEEIGCISEASRSARARGLR